jgi:hypothetical protein
LYAIFGISLGILSAMPHLTLRIHHYILALLLLPGTSMQTRISLLAQGLLVGLFINGVARWNFDSILQTAAQLRGDAQLGSGIPSILEPVIAGTNITFTWKGLLRGYEGISVIVNDVERFRGIGTESNFTWTRRAMDLPEYFRFGFINYAPFGGVGYSDFTMERGAVSRQGERSRFAAPFITQMLCSMVHSFSLVNTQVFCAPALSMQ